MREVTTGEGQAIVRCSGIGKRSYAVGGGGTITGGGSYRIKGGYPVQDARGQPNGWAVDVVGVQRYTIKVYGSQTTSKTVGGYPGTTHTHQYDPGSRLLPLEGYGKPAEVRVFAICVRLD